jgi:DNA-dependent RNA polymerase auxiliary subunit epsilon
MFLFALVALAIFVPPPGSMPISPNPPPKVLILSSVESQYPMQYMVNVTADLKQAGYNVTFVKGTAITVGLITTQLDKYDIVIWRTDMYVHGNTTYWYLGEQANQTTLEAYSAAISIRTIDVSNGMLAVSASFLSSNYGPKSLANVKLAILISSMSITIAQIFISAGVKTTIDFYQTLNAPLNLFDWVTKSLVAYLTTGNDVRDSIAKTIFNYEYVSSLDDSYLPPISFLGNGNLQIV